MGYSVFDLREETGIENHIVLESYDMIDEDAYVEILQYENGQLYLVEEGTYSTGAPFFKYEKIEAQDYTIYKNPDKINLKKLLSKRFFNQTLFLIFIKDERNLKLINEIIAENEPIEIENHYVKNWFKNINRHN